MAPTLVRPPFHREGWVYEKKVDGWRMLAYKDRLRVRLFAQAGLSDVILRRIRWDRMSIRRTESNMLIMHGAVTPRSAAES